jgi:hypothetical protein
MRLSSNENDQEGAAAQRTGRMESDENQMPRTLGVPHSTAREIAGFDCEDGDRSMEKLTEASQHVPFTSEPADTSEDGLIEAPQNLRKILLKPT